MEVLVLLAATTCLNICFCEENVTTNSSDSNKDIGNQEALTLYHTNGSNIDLSGLSTPLLTNVTAQSVVGVAPKSPESGSIPWSALDRLINVQQTSPNVKSAQNNMYRKAKRSWDSVSSIFKRDITEDEVPVKIVKGTAKIPESAAVTSLVIPPLLMLNMSEIPVPIPNTSVVHYAKVNTLIKNTDKS